MILCADSLHDVSIALVHADDEEGPSPVRMQHFPHVEYRQCEAVADMYRYCTDSVTVPE